MDRIDIQALRFLLVDDSTSMRRVVRSMLAGFGVRHIEEAGDGAEALEAIGRSPPDIMITDWNMPVLDGLDLVKLCRQRSASDPYLPIIMITGHAERHHVIRARDVGVTEFLCKPVSPKALYERIVSIVLYPRPFVSTKSYFGPDRRRFVQPDYKGEDKRQPPSAASTAKNEEHSRAEGSLT